MRTQVAAIEFGTSKIVTVIAENGGFNRCDIIGSGTVPYDGYQGGDWVTPNRLAQAVYNSISAAEKDAGTILTWARRLQLAVRVSGPSTSVSRERMTPRLCANANTSRSVSCAMP